MSEKARIAQQEKEDKQRLERLNERQAMMGKKPFASLDDVPSDYEEPDAYLDEAAAITLDLAKKVNS